MEDVNEVQNVEVVDEGIQYIVVRIGSEQYGIDIRYVDNIVRNQRITRVPRHSHISKALSIFVVRLFRL